MSLHGLIATKITSIMNKEQDNPHSSIHTWVSWHSSELDHFVLYVFNGFGESRLSLLLFDSGLQVRISNGSPMTVQLVSRQWDIRCLDTKTAKPVQSQVKGPGVVGQQPVLEPGQFFEYTR